MESHNAQSMSSLRAWGAWVVILAIATAAMHHVRDHLDQAHVALAYLLIVLGGAVSGGRALAVTLACSGFLLIDYYFQPPYDMLSIGKPLDLVVLLAFLATAMVATQLLSRAQADAARARQRADEVNWLSRLGSEALNAGRAEDALHAIADVIRRTLDARACVIFAGLDASGRPSPAAQAGGLDAVARARAAEVVTAVAARGVGAAVDPDGGVRFGAAPGKGDDAIGIEASDACEIVLPLQVNGRSAGVLLVSSTAPLAHDRAKRRFLNALAYYAALGVERVRLEAAAEHAVALREADRLKDFVLASVSHDLRTPLTAIKALAQDSAHRGDENAVIIEEQADRLGRLVNDLLDLSRIKAGAYPVRLELNTAEDLVGAVVRQLSGVLDGRLQIGAVDLDQPALVGRFDFVQSMRILVNLIENANRYAPPDTPIDVSVQRDAAMLRFAVADHGPGVPVTERERIFEPFYRPEGSAPDTRAGGAGLGLAIARSLATAQGGSLRYEPRQGRGSVFTLFLPAVDVHAESAEPPPLAAANQ